MGPSFRAGACKSLPSADGCPVTLRRTARAGPLPVAARHPERSSQADDAGRTARVLQQARPQGPGAAARRHRYCLLGAQEDVSRHAAGLNTYGRAARQEPFRARDLLCVLWVTSGRVHWHARRWLLTRKACRVHAHTVKGSRKVLEDRMANRKGHFFAPKMLDSQLATLERCAS